MHARAVHVHVAIQAPVLRSCACRGADWPGGEALQPSAPGGGRGHET